jgi:hypothetical protein
MPVNRTLWKLSIEANDVPAWRCPGCGAAVLQIVDDSFRTVVDRKSHNFSPEDYHPAAITGRFVCLLTCSKCHESCAVSGNYVTDVYEGDEGFHEFVRGHPTSVTPPPPIFGIPAKCPVAIKQEVIVAFSAYWSDHASSLNHIRQALELLLTDLGIPRTTVNSRHKRIDLALHSRIDKLKSKKPKLAEVCERMLAVKHLGNAGSHPGAVKADDVFDGFDILERVLYDTYSAHSGTLAKLVKQINKRKGPRKAQS